MNETRGWGATATTLMAEAALSFTKGEAGSYGPAQLGPAARNYAGLTIREALTIKGAIRGAASWIDYQRTQLMNQGVSNPNVAQIASRYNARLAGSPPGTITKYGLQIKTLVESE